MRKSLCSHTTHLLNVESTPTRKIKTTYLRKTVYCHKKRKITLKKGTKVVGIAVKTFEA